MKPRLYWPLVGTRFPSGMTPSIARRLRWQSSLEGLKPTKWTLAIGFFATPSRFGLALHAKGLSSELKSARWGIAVPLG